MGQGATSRRPPSTLGHGSGNDSAPKHGHDEGAARDENAEAARPLVPTLLPSGSLAPMSPASHAFCSQPRAQWPYEVVNGNPITCDDCASRWLPPRPPHSGFAATSPEGRTWAHDVEGGWTRDGNRHLLAVECLPRWGRTGHGRREEVAPFEVVKRY